MKYKKIKNGFTLIEILLVIGVIMIMSIIKVRDINNDTDDMQAKILSSQIQTVAEATNAFLVLKYNELSSLSSPSVSCNTGANTCNITLQNLSDNALLPPNFSSTTIFGNPYEIQLKRTGTAPNYMISGLVLTKGIKNTENTPSFVFLGNVLRNIGRDGGLNKTTGQIIGTFNGWSANSDLFPILSNKINYIGEAVGTLSGAYYVYLRRDGSLPMTGDLNMDGHNIKNVNNLTATGYLKTTGNIQGEDISANGSLTVNGSTTLNGILQVNNNITASGNIDSNKVVSGQYLKAKQVVVSGSQCNDNGSQAIDSIGQPYNCINNVWRIVGDLAGTIKMWAGSIAPSGWLELNGQSFNVKTNSELAKIFPSGVLPDFRGQFVRAWDNGRGIDVSRSNLSTQGDAIRNISGFVSGIGGVRFDGYSGAFYDTGARNGQNAQIAGSCSSNCNDDFAFDASRVVPTASENRPKNIAVMYIIKNG